MLEGKIERSFKAWVEGRGFKLLKLYTPGDAGSMDRLLLRPRYWPGPPMVVEFKQPGKALRPLQRAKADDWRKRGVIVLPVIDSLDRAAEIRDYLFRESHDAYALAVESQIYDRPIER